MCQIRTRRLDSALPPLSSLSPPSILSPVALLTLSQSLDCLFGTPALRNTRPSLRYNVGQNSGWKEGRKRGREAGEDVSAARRSRVSHDHRQHTHPRHPTQQHTTRDATQHATRFSPLTLSLWMMTKCRSSALPIRQRPSCTNPSPPTKAPSAGRLSLARKRRGPSRRTARVVFLVSSIFAAAALRVSSCFFWVSRSWTGGKGDGE